MKPGKRKRSTHEERIVEVDNKKSLQACLAITPIASCLQPDMIQRKLAPSPEPCQSCAERCFGSTNQIFWETDGQEGFVKRKWYLSLRLSGRGKPGFLIPPLPFCQIRLGTGAFILGFPAYVCSVPKPTLTLQRHQSASMPATHAFEGRHSIRND